MLYAAFSTATNDSTEQQIDDCRKRAAAEGWTVIGEYSDVGHSGFKGNRGPQLEAAMAAALEAATKDQPCVLLVRDSTRLARGDATGPDGARSLGEVFIWAQRSYVTLRSVRDDAYFSNPVLVAVADMMAHGESQLKSQRSISGVQKRKAAGKHVGGRILGYKAVDDLLTPVPDEAALVKRIFSELASGISQAELTRRLNREMQATGSPTPLRGALWRQGSISQMIRRRTYLGEIPVLSPREAKKQNIAAQWIKGAHEAIVTEALFDAANAACAARARAPGNAGGPRPKGNQLLTGRLLRHGACGLAMRPRTHARRNGDLVLRYECGGKKEGVCNGLVVDAVAVDAAITSFLAELGIDAAASLQAAEAAVESIQAHHSAAIAHAATEAKSASEALTRIRADYVAHEITAAEWRGFKGELEGKLAETQATIEELEAQAPEAPQQIVNGTISALAIVRAAIDAGNHPEVQAAIEHLFESFSIYEDRSEAALAEELAAQGQAIDLEAARKRLRGVMAAAEAKAGRTVADANAQALEEMANEPDDGQQPVADPDESIEIDGYLIVTKPRQEALMAIAEDGSQAFRKRTLPVMTNMTGLVKHLVISLSRILRIAA